MWVLIIVAVVIVGLIALQWLLAPYTTRRSSRRGATTSTTTDLQVLEAQARSTRDQNFGSGGI